MHLPHRRVGRRNDALHDLWELRTTSSGPSGHAWPVIFGAAGVSQGMIRTGLASLPKGSCPTGQGVGRGRPNSAGPRYNLKALNDLNERPRAADGEKCLPLFPGPCVTLNG
jgi:hypothetical protein